MLLLPSVWLKSNSNRAPRLPRRICPSSFAYTVVDLEQLYINPPMGKNKFCSHSGLQVLEKKACVCVFVIGSESHFFFLSTQTVCPIMLTILPPPISESFPESLNLLLHLQKKRRRRHKVHCGGTIAAATCRCHGSVTQQASGRGDCYVLWVPVTQNHLPQRKTKRRAAGE